MDQMEAQLDDANQTVALQNVKQKALEEKAELGAKEKGLLEAKEIELL